MTNEHGKPKFEYVLDGERLHWDKPEITGWEIKSRLPDEGRHLELFLIKEVGSERELEPIRDEQTASLRDGLKHFEAKQRQHKVFIYFVDGDKFESDSAHTTGRINDPISAPLLRE